MKSRNNLMAIPSLLLAVTAMAAGNHGGGHADQAIGKPGVAAKVTRTVNVEMTDSMRFIPSTIAVKKGETLRLVVKNSGKIKHELVLGTQKELREHYELMKKNPEMEHADANQVTVAPGKTGEVIWQFTKAGKVDFACLQPGHYDAGMKGLVTVADGKAAEKSSGHFQHTQGGTMPMTDAKKMPTVNEANMAEGEVRKVDKEAMKITLKHGEIKNLDMPGMTMVFQVKDPALLDKVKTGDKVRFTAEKSNGAIVVTDLQPAK